MVGHLMTACVGLALGPILINANQWVSLGRLPNSFVALGDSFSAGIGSGEFLKSSRDRKDYTCGRQDGAYPWWLTTIVPRAFNDGHVVQLNDFVSCSGAVMKDIDGQLKSLTDTFEVATLSITGNDYGFGEVVKKCVYASYAQTGFVGESAASLACDMAIRSAQTKLGGWNVWNEANVRATIRSVANRALAPGGILFVTGYPAFFAPAFANDVCDDKTFFPSDWFTPLKLRFKIRNDINGAIASANRILAQAVAEVNREDRNGRIEFVDPDASPSSWDTHRFCELSRGDDPRGATNEDVWFNAIDSNLEERNSGWPTPRDGNDLRRAVAERQPNNETAPKLQERDTEAWPDATIALVQASAFHPKRLGNRQIAYNLRYLIATLFKPGNLVSGGNDGCRWSGQQADCYHVPAGCVVLQQDEGVLQAICKDGTRDVEPAGSFD
ncbi:SGNH hydrolase [Microthyrium microscopicum]|uniref:SGNH hydrolase n=1 Tax=Microthyrium microscopicum TaxID=703497 RepID=A0A6A6US43_9PEZI|nr:SGNH hydrolase [Microthyrium microscopicum]